MERQKRLRQYAKKRDEIVRFYLEHDESLRITGEHFGLTPQRIHAIVRNNAEYQSGKGTTS